MNRLSSFSERFVGEGLTFDDVLLVPAESNASSRRTWTCPPTLLRPSGSIPPS